MTKEEKKAQKKMEKENRKNQKNVEKELARQEYMEAVSNSNSEVEALVNAMGVGMFTFFKWAFLLLVVSMCLYFVLQSIYVFIVLVLSVISLFR